MLASYLHIYTNAGPETWTCVTGDDRFLVNMPLFHIGGMGVTYKAVDERLRLPVALPVEDIAPMIDGPGHADGPLGRRDVAMRFVTL